MKLKYFGTDATQDRSITGLSILFLVHIQIYLNVLMSLDKRLYQEHLSPEPTQKSQCDRVTQWL